MYTLANITAESFSIQNMNDLMMLMGLAAGAVALFLWQEIQELSKPSRVKKSDEKKDGQVK